MTHFTKNFFSIKNTLLFSYSKVQLVKFGHYALLAYFPTFILPLCCNASFKLRKSFLRVKKRPEKRPALLYLIIHILKTERERGRKSAPETLWQCCSTSKVSFFSLIWFFLSSLLLWSLEGVRQRKKQKRLTVLKLWWV